MSLRRLHPDQPAGFAFTPENAAWAQAQIAKYPEGRQMSAVIPLLWRAQEQEGWLTKPAIETVARMLGMAEIRVLEVATFYFMFQLEPVGTVAHVQVCGTTPCMLCGSESLIEVCKTRISAQPHHPSADGKFSWEEVECLGACSNAPMVQIGKDYYEDLTPEKLAALLDAFARGEVPVPGPQNGRFASEPLGGATTLKAHAEGRLPENGSVTLALAQGDTVARITGQPVAAQSVDLRAKAAVERPATRPAALKKAREGKADDLRKIKGVGPKLQALLNSLGFYHFDQIAAWTDAEVAWVDEHLDDFKGRVTRDDWVAQAKILAAGGETAFSARAEADAD
jgi:NADH-quinone oxidoreductase subunit E